MIRNKKRKKTFTSNADYFKWYNDNKDKINIISVDTTIAKTKVEYEDKEVDND